MPFNYKLDIKVGKGAFRIVPNIASRRTNRYMSARGPWGRTIKQVDLTGIKARSVAELKRPIAFYWYSQNSKL
jgi:hypothetical protein